MRAVLLEAPCDPAELKVVEVPVPEASPGEVVVRVHASAINRSDVLNARGLPITVFPRIPGRDFAGTVVEGPDELLGRAVWGTGSGDLGFTRHGAHAQLLKVPVDALVDQPRGWSAAQAGASGLSYVAAEAGLSRMAIASGEIVLVTGAAGGVGSAACAIARWRGAKVIGVVKDGAERELLLRRFPGVVAVNGSDGDVTAAVAEAAGGAVHAAFDTVGNALFAQIMATLGMGARMAVIAGVPNAEVPLDLSAYYRRALSLYGVNTTAHTSAWCAELLRALGPGFADGSLPPIDVARTLDLADAAEGYQAVWAGEPGGRVVFQPDGTGANR